MSLEDTGAKYYLRPSWSETFLIPRELLPELVHVVTDSAIIHMKYQPLLILLQDQGL